MPRWDKTSKLIGKKQWYVIDKNGNVLRGPYFTKQQAKDESWDLGKVKIVDMTKSNPSRKSVDREHSTSIEEAAKRLRVKRKTRKKNPSVKGVKFVLKKVPINQGGYDRRGRYYGVGAPLYRYEDYETGDISGEFRAYTKAEAVERLKALVEHKI